LIKIKKNRKTGGEVILLDISTNVQRL